MLKRVLVTDTRSPCFSRSSADRSMAEDDAEQLLSEKEQGAEGDDLDKPFTLREKTTFSLICVVGPLWQYLLSRRALALTVTI